jgi:hypothetical protein
MMKRKWMAGDGRVRELMLVTIQFRTPSHNKKKERIRGPIRLKQILYKDRG